MKRFVIGTISKSTVTTKDNSTVYKIGLQASHASYTLTVVCKSKKLRRTN
jgi:hypothetical protein